MQCFTASLPLAFTTPPPNFEHLCGCVFFKGTPSLVGLKENRRNTTLRRGPLKTDTHPYCFWHLLKLLLLASLRFALLATVLGANFVCARARQTKDRRALADQIERRWWYTCSWHYDKGMNFLEAPEPIAQQRSTFCLALLRWSFGRRRRCHTR